MLSAFSFYRWWHRVEYAPLFTNMQAGSAGKVVEKLKALEIPYRLTDGGSRKVRLPDPRGSQKHNVVGAFKPSHLG
ncbi:MAG: hypothetical protein ACOX0E_04750 [Syntrophomonadaceae bacterium]